VQEHLQVSIALAESVGWVSVVLNATIADKSTTLEVRMKAEHEITDLCKRYQQLEDLAAGWCHATRAPEGDSRFAQSAGATYQSWNRKFGLPKLATGAEGLDFRNFFCLWTFASRTQDSTDQVWKGGGKAAIGRVCN
jgi:hypothetical protein